MRQHTTLRAEISAQPIRLALAIFFASAFFALSPSASAQECDPVETHKLLAADGAEGDNFGYSVAISGTTAIVGAYLDDDNGKWSGSAYIFDTITGRQIAKLLPDDGAMEDNFGSSVAISGTTAIVGAWQDDDNGYESGSAYLFDTTTGRQIAKLLPDDGAAWDYFGHSVAISGNTAIVGAHQDDDNAENSGSAYLFDTATGRQIAKLLANDGAANDLFGFSVAISGTTAIVGAVQDDDNGGDSGSAYIFDTTTGRQIAKLLPEDGAAGDRFGYSVAISGTTTIVGTPGHDDIGHDSGSAYLFDTTTGRQITKILSSDGAHHDLFGFSVAISGTTAIVGAPRNDDNGFRSGSAYLFDTITGRQGAKLLASDGAEWDWFGRSVAITGTTAIVGAHWDDDNGEDSGSAYTFDITCEPSLRIVGSCPGRIGFQASNVTPGGQVAFLYASGQGSVTIPPGNPCAGTVLGLNATVRLGATVRADANGLATVIANIPAQACGSIFVQALDVESCATSNIVRIE